MDIIDLRDIIENRESHPQTYHEWDRALMRTVGETIEEVAAHEPLMIPASHFVQYVQDLVVELGLIDPDSRLFNAVNWNVAAAEFKHNYRVVVVNGVLHYFRDY